MAAKIGSEARRANPALNVFDVLVGEWKTIGTHPEVPGKTFHGRSSFEWIEGGAYLLMRSEIDEPEIPSGLAIFGSDDAAGTYFMLYFDERGVSRKFDVTMNGRTLEWHRDNPEFAQHCTLTVEDEGRKLRSTGRMSRAGGAWTDDLALNYERIV